MEGASAPTPSWSGGPKLGLLTDAPSSWIGRWRRRWTARFRRRRCERPPRTRRVATFPRSPMHRASGRYGTASRTPTRRTAWVPCRSSSDATRSAMHRCLGEPRQSLQRLCPARRRRLPVARRGQLTGIEIADDRGYARVLAALGWLWGRCVVPRRIHLDRGGPFTAPTGLGKFVGSACTGRRTGVHPDSRAMAQRHHRALQRHLRLALLAPRTLRGPGPAQRTYKQVRTLHNAQHRYRATGRSAPHETPPSVAASWPEHDELLDALISRLAWIEAVPRPM
jgi:hypothetical protein